MNTIYHYCSPESFFSIIQNQRLWLSSMDHMNDYMEKKWFYSTLKKYLYKNLDANCVDQFIAHLDDNISIGTPFACCLSKSGDILSQWRAYAKDGFGVSIGFDREKLDVYDGIIGNNLDPKHRLTLSDISYMDINVIECLAERILSRYSFIKKYYMNEIISTSKFNRYDKCILELISNIIHLNTTTKNPAFKEEKEVRLVYQTLDTGRYEYPESSSIKDLKYRISNNQIISYYELGFPKDAVSELILGPPPKFKESDIVNFLQYNGFEHSIKILKSKASYGA
ncbi:hypothetical protein SPFCAV_00904 [Salmonella enterica subsp. enterica serovar Gallinarum/Pullorum str. FCAV198]|nr:DUF2971 domain-containing protein [Salmonella enterica]ETX34450.1 hypothetical protein SPFCAV_00904 [Salmonella enterica subsp. enterica serovar Gallinarum/Pullorum str. FCAV198]